MQVIYLIRDYERMQRELRFENVRIQDGTKDLYITEMNRKVEAISACLEEIPEEYRDSIYNNIVHRIPYDTRYASYKTYTYHRSKFISNVARALGM